MSQRYDCLSCGAHVNVVETSTWVGLTYTAEAAVSHGGPQDAACTWFIETLSAELQTLLDLRVRQLRDILR